MMSLPYQGEFTNVAIWNVTHDRFGIFLGISFNKNADTLQLAMHGPIEVAIGLSFGLAWGLLAQWIPSKDNPNCAFFR